MTPEQYVYMKAKNYVYLHPNGATILDFSSPKKHTTVSTNKTGAEILSRLNGLNTLSQIVEDLSQRFDQAKDEVKNDVFNFVKQNLEHIDFASEPVNVPDRIIGNRRYYSPISVVIELTKKCNLKCGYCYVDKSTTMREMTTSQVYEGMRNMFDQGIRSLTLTGGEVFIRNDAVDIIQFAYRLFPWIRVQTNGTLVDRKIVDALKDCKNIFFGISIDGLEDMHDRVRGKGNFRRTIEAIRLLKSAGFYVQILTVLSPENMDFAQKIPEFAHELSVSFATSPVLPYGNAKDFVKKLDYKNYIEKYYNEMRKTQPLGGLEKLHTAPIDGTRIQGCGAGVHHIEVSPNGDIYPCLMLSEEKFRMGNILTDELGSIFKVNSLEHVDLFNLTKIRCTSCETPRSLKSFCKHCLALRKTYCPFYRESK